MSEPEDGRDPAATRTIEGHQVVLNGRSVHSRLWFKIYEVSLYLESPSRKAEEILESDSVKLVRMKFLRNIKAEQFRDSWKEAFEDNCEESCRELNPYLLDLNSKIVNFLKGDVLEFVFENRSMYIFSPKLGRINFESAEFGRVVLSIWLGKHPPSQSFKKALLGLKD